LSLGGEPFPAPEAFEVEVVAGDLDSEGAAIVGCIHSELGCALAELPVEVRVHSFHDIISIYTYEYY
jgi:hypothetical protein